MSFRYNIFNGTLDNIGSSSGGTVTSVALTAPPEFTVSGSPVTNSGTITITKANETANTVWAGPTSGPAAQPTFRAVVPSDIPTLNQNTTGSAGSFTGSLSGDITGTQSATVVSLVGGQSAASVATAATSVASATSSNTPNTLVERDGSGNFSAGTITASLNGNANTSTTSTNFSGSLSGDVTGTQSATVVATVGGSTAANIHSAELAANSATSSNTPNTIVKRDGSGNFSAGTITASLTGHASSDLALAGGTMSGAIDMGTNQIHNVVNPTGAQDAATKAYVDAGLAALNPSEAVYAASTTNIVGTYFNGVGGVGATFTVTAAGAFSIDGVSPPLNSRILIKNQSSGFQNGIYNLTVVGTGLTSPVLTRSLDYDMPSDINNVGLIPVINGTVNALSSWQQIATITTVGTDALVFTEFTANPSLYLLKANNLSDVASKNASRGPSGLNIDERSTFSNTNYTVLSTDRYVAQIGTMTASWVVTLPAASSVNAGQLLIIADESGTVNTTNILTITAAGSDTINGSASKTIRSAYGEAYLVSNGTNGWFRPVTGIGSGGTGLSTVPTDGQLLIGQSSTSSYVQSTLTAGSNVTITNGGGSITIAAASGSSSTLTGYVSSPGIVSATDTVLTAIEKLNGNDEIFLNNQPNAYTIIASDFNKIVQFTGSVAVTYSVTAAATLGNGWHCYIKNNGTGTANNGQLSISPLSGGLIDGQATIVTYPGDSRLVVCDGTNFTTSLLAGGFVEYAVSGSTPVFTVPTRIEYAHVELWGGGGGGGSGRRGAAATARSGGSAGGGGAYVQQWFKAADLGTSVTVSIANTSGGGAARTTDDTNGVAGSDGGNSTFGALLTGYGGGGGAAGTATTGNGGGGGGSLTAAVGNAGGGPNASANGNSLGGSSGNTGVGGENAYGGAAGGGVPAGAAGKNGGNSFRGGSGGGSGGGITAADATSVGGAGGAGQGALNGTGGAAGTNPGGNGGTGVAGPSSYGPGTAGGGGGASKTTAAGSGGNGGIASGGGGGGASLDGFNSGAGGNGGSGLCRIWYG